MNLITDKAERKITTNLAPAQLPSDDTGPNNSLVINAIHYKHNGGELIFSVRAVRLYYVPVDARDSGTAKNLTLCRSSSDSPYILYRVPCARYSLKGLGNFLTKQLEVNAEFISDYLRKLNLTA